ncbi:uncharacterized protein LOC135492024 [Lineus longissimus]|uniref:uncharacterized protein LOC135492024 n=1 Tax=Lineus longissimus TaxID=88925 RepID=UPI002B4DFDD7
MGNSALSKREKYAKAYFKKIVDERAYKDFDVDFEYENLVLSGGGDRACTYVGAAKVLDDLGILPKIKRFAGTSMGSVIAATLAVGASPVDLYAFILEDLDRTVMDSSSVTKLYNVVTKYGWHSGEAVTKKMREVLNRFTGNPDLTFEQLYKMRGIELCVVVTNLTSQSVEYWHPKTQPDMSIAVAVRASVSLPFLFQPTQVEDIVTGDSIYCVDGGILKNFPLNAYDGWYLSLMPKDSFFHRIGSKDLPLGEVNPRTLGIKVFSALMEDQSFSSEIRRFKSKEVTRPDTSYAKLRGPIEDTARHAREVEMDMMQAAIRFITFLSKFSTVNEEGILTKGFKLALEGLAPTSDSVDAFNGKDWNLLFGENRTIAEITSDLNSNEDDVISNEELLNHFSKHGVLLRRLMINKPASIHQLRRKINSLYDFAHSISDSYYHELQCMSHKEEDEERTIPIYSDYISMVGPRMTLKDKEFIVKQGYEATLAFFEEKAEQIKEKGKEEVVDVKNI